MDDVDDVYGDLPDDPQLAFAYLENLYKNQMNAAIGQAEEQTDTTPYYIQYMNKTIAAAKVLELGVLQDRAPPTHKSTGWAAYYEFSTEVEHIVEQIRITHARRRRQYSVAFDNTTKTKIRHHLGQIKEIVDKLEVSEKKREALYKGINDLQAEVDRNRTRYEAFAALTIETADVADEALKPLIRLIDAISVLFGRAKDLENSTKQLAAPAPLKQIVGPKAKPLENAGGGGWEPPADLDDEIPF